MNARQLIENVIEVGLRSPSEITPRSAVENNVADAIEKALIDDDLDPNSAAYKALRAQWMQQLKAAGNSNPSGTISRFERETGLFV